jgi:hypothetical protein
MAQRNAISVSVDVLERRFVRLAAFNQEQPPHAVHQGGTAALSCRLCLIACNSRKFTREAIACTDHQGGPFGD